MSAKFMLVGGGTGGHITPNLAVAHALKHQHPDCKVVYVLEKDSKFKHMVADNPDLDQVRQLSAGKLRRYHGESWLRRLADVKTNALNVRDVFRLLIGLVEAWRLLRREQPAVIFIKGGFVGLPVGLAAAWLRIPFVTHDSDSLPGLSNRVVARWARLRATGMPTEFYSYSPEKTVYVGVPLAEHYQHVSEGQQQALKQDLGLASNGQMLLITGGSNGAENINMAIAAIADTLLQTHPNLTIVHQVGRGQLKVYAGRQLPERLQVHEFLAPADMVRYSGAADIIVTRAGATTIAEYAAQGKACIIIPNPLLTGGHQVKNAEHLAAQNAIEIYFEADLEQPERLADAISSLLAEPERRRQLAEHLHTLARPRAAADIAGLLYKLATEQSA